MPLIPAILGIIGALAAGWRGMLGMAALGVIVPPLVSSGGLLEGEMFSPSLFINFGLGLVPGSILLIARRQFRRMRDRRPKHRDTQTAVSYDDGSPQDGVEP
ncbi:hypothetical protein [Roseomonas indoligenes]|uniref:Uncharacterized protein n=1 Tax=Roseomonas indoligenes TaxID=2820811 RepID=A0A940N380_9PROT|nr:hypothetical protein [Pararoseomonas indoligenes]MBP0495744.1 hypothetical protein [Pararoseomonas indoligenes]